MTPKEIAILAAKALDSKKGEDIKVMEVTALTTLADYFVICTGASSTQINALCDAVGGAAGEGGGGEAPPPGGPPGRHLGAAGLRLRGGPRI